MRTRARRIAQLEDAANAGSRARAWCIATADKVTAAWKAINVQDSIGPESTDADRERILARLLRTHGLERSTD